MKNTLYIFTLVVLLAACGKQDAPEPTVESAPAPEQQAADGTAPDSAESADELAAETLEIVEESAAEPEPEDQAIILAQADTTDAPQDWKFTADLHFYRLVPSQPTMGGADKIEVAEFFWYGCPHCYDFEGFINTWEQEIPANVRLVRIPAMWNNLVKLHGRLYYTEEVLARNGVIKDPAGFREAVFQEYHRRGNRLTTEASIQALFARFGVSEEQFQRTWNSFEVDQKMRVAEDLARRYAVSNVPTVVVNGKYRTGGSEAGSYPRLIEVIDELILRESIR